MSKYASAILFPLFLTASSLLPTARHASPPPPGPGAVIEAIEKFLQAADAGDRARLEKMFVPMHRGEGIDYVIDPATQKLTYRQSLQSADAGSLFQDTGADGKPVNAATTAAAVDTLLQKVGGAERELGSRLVSVHADCPGAECSWGSVEFERTFRHEGQRMMVPMHATVLVRYQQEEPHMRIFLWHAAPSGPVQMLKGGIAK